MTEMWVSATHFAQDGALFGQRGVPGPDGHSLAVLQFERTSGTQACFTPMDSLCETFDVFQIDTARGEAPHFASTRLMPDPATRGFMAVSPPDAGARSSVAYVVAEVANNRPSTSGSDVEMLRAVRAPSLGAARRMLAESVVHGLPPDTRRAY